MRGTDIVSTPTAHPYRRYALAGFALVMAILTLGVAVNACGAPSSKAATPIGTRPLTNPPSALWAPFLPASPTPTPMQTPVPLPSVIPETAHPAPALSPDCHPVTVWGTLSGNRSYQYDTCLEQLPHPDPSLTPTPDVSP